MSNKKGEIVSILTISSLVILGTVSLISTVFLKRIGKTQPRASGCSQVSSVSYSPSSISAGQTFTCTLSGSIVNQYTMACGWSKNGGWPQGMESGACPGSTCIFTLKMEDNIDPNATYELAGYDFRDECGPDTGKRVSLPVVGVNSQQSEVIPPVFSERENSSVGNGCFNIKAEFEVRSEGDKKAFYSWVTFSSDKGGDIKLEYNGIHVAGWNNFNGGIFTYNPQWTQPHTHDYESGIAGFSGKSHMPFNYRGTHSGCQPKDIALNCAVGIDDQGPYVSGEGCSCRNCQPRPLQTSIGNSTSISAESTTPRSTSTPAATPIDDCLCVDGYWQGKLCDSWLRRKPCEDNILTSTPTPTPTRTSSPRATNIPTPTPTPLTSLPDHKEVIALKGTASFFIPFVNSQYYNDYVNFYKREFLSVFSSSLRRETDCNVNCTYEGSTIPSPEGIKIEYNNIDRYYLSNNSLTPNQFYFLAYYLGNSYKKTFNFQNYYQDSLTFNDLSPVDLARYYRKISLEFTNEDDYLYQEGNSIEVYVDPPPLNYNNISNVGFDKEFDIIYISFDNPLPSKIVIHATYACGTDSQSNTKTATIFIPESGSLNSTENDVGVIELKCSD